MRIAVSGTHCIGKSTLIEDFIKRHPHYKSEIEPYYQLQEEKTMELSLVPTLDSLMEQLECSIQQLNNHAKEVNMIYDRCPIDFIAYAMCILDQDGDNINDSEISEKFSDVKTALNTIDLIVFLPITNKHLIEYNEENPHYRKAADKCFKKIYRDDECDVFPKYGHPKIIEIWGDRLTRLKKIESYL